MPRREFPVAVQKAAFKRAAGKCEICCLPFAGRPEYHHRREDFFGGAPTLENCQCICSKCHRLLTSKAAPKMAKTRRQAKAQAGIKSKGRPIPGSKRSPWKSRLTSEGQKPERR